MGRRLKDNIRYFSHDADAWSNPKFRALRAHYGEEKGWAMEAKFWALNCMIAHAEGCRLDLRKPFVQADLAQQLQLSLQEFNDFIRFLSNQKACDLLNNDSGIVWTDRCDEELSEARKSREKDRLRKMATSDGIHPGSSSIPPGIDDNPYGIRRFPGSEQQRAEQRRLEANSSEKKEVPDAGQALEAPPADAAAEPEPSEPVFSPVILRKQLVAAGITLDKSQLQELYQELPPTPFEARACLAYMLRRMEEAHDIRKPVPYFLKVKALWIAEWTREKPASEPEQKKKSNEPNSGLPPALEELKAERERQEADPAILQATALNVAHLHQKLHSPLTEEDRKALEVAGEAVAEPLFDSEDTFPESDKADAPSENPQFEDDLPYPEEPKKDEEEEILF